MTKTKQLGETNLKNKLKAVNNKPVYPEEDRKRRKRRKRRKLILANIPGDVEGEGGVERNEQLFNDFIMLKCF